MRGVTDIKTSTTPRVEILCRPKSKNENFRLTAIPDTGAEVTICSPDVIQKMKIPRKEIKQSSNYKLIAANGSYTN